MRFDVRLITTGVVMAAGVLISAQSPEPAAAPLHQHAAIQYATRPTTDRVAKLSRTLAETGRSLQRDSRTGYLLPILKSLGVPVESQLLVFSKTGVQRAHTNPHTPRALY